MKKYWIPIIAVLGLALCVSLVFILNGQGKEQTVCEPPSDELKDEIELAYYDFMEWKCQLGSGWVIWYDENGGVEENKVWRYIGTYGDCLAFLRIGDNEDGTGFPGEIPYPVTYLTRTVYYPHEADVWLYNLKKPAGPTAYNPDCHLMDLGDVRLLELDWLTDAQLEQLTADIEKMANGN